MRGHGYHLALRLLAASRPEGPPSVLYHGAPAEFAGSIAEFGIVPGGGRGPGRNWLRSDPECVYLAADPQVAAMWGMQALDRLRAMGLHEGEGDVVVLAIDTSALDAERVRPESPHSTGQWKHRGAIPPLAISGGERYDWSG